MYIDYFDKFYNMKPYLEIDEKDWEYIKETFDKDDVKESLAKVAMTYPLPYPDLTEKRAYKDFQKLKGMKWNEIMVEGEWYAREGTEYTYNLNYDKKQLYFRRLNAGNEASNYFQIENRWSVDGSVSPGPKRTWGSHKFMTTLMGSAYSLKMPKINKNILRTMIGLRKYICSQFKPNVAKIIYDMFKSENILDFSMGWGDRLAGFYASEHGKHYVGLDPRGENHPIYKEQSEFYEKHLGFFEHERKSEFHCSPAEDFDFAPYNEYFDMVFTSPPYFSVERYSYDDTQSWVRYKDINDWNKDFLQSTLGNLWGSIKKGGYLLVNISDVYTNSKWSTERGWLEICNPMNDYLSKLGEYQGCIGMEMAKRPNSGGAGTAKSYEGSVWTEKSLENKQDKKFGEPIWVWKKN
tara:strand:- start:6100 stop:7320 length:1221 start_codon:yes stop_codon:yes gene_type:complete